MNDPVAAIRRVYYDYLDDPTKLSDLENFLYSNEWIREVVGEDDYLELISINFHARDVRFKLGEILVKHVGWAEHQKELLVSDFRSILMDSERTPEILSDLYDKYCDGYYFLNDLGLGYGLCCTSPHIDGKSYDSWEDLDSEQQRRVLEGFHQQLKSDVRRALDWVESGKIVLMNNRDELNRMKFEDFRTIEEKQSTVWKEVQRSEDGGSSVSRSLITIKGIPLWKRFLKMLKPNI